MTKKIDFHTVSSIIIEFDDFLAASQNNLKGLTPETRELLAKIFDEWSSSKSKSNKDNVLASIIRSYAELLK